MTTAPKPPASPPAQFDDPPPFQPVAGVLAFLLPGLGHAWLGETARGVRIGAGILGLYLGGLLIGGIDVVDRREDFVWFLGQALVGPIAFGTDYVHQRSFKVVGPTRVERIGEVDQFRSAYAYEIRDPANGRAVRVRDPGTGRALEFKDPRTGAVRMSTPADRPPNTKSVGRVNELGTLFSTIAGMLNLICMIDAMFRRRVGRAFSFARAAGGGKR